MKIKGSSGKLSKTLAANAIFAGAQAALGMTQYLEQVMSMELYIVAVVLLTMIHSSAGNWIRAKTTGPLQ